MKITQLSDSELLVQTKKLVHEERRIGLRVLEHLEEIDRRRLFASEGYDSLFAYATQALGYAESAAIRRIQAMRLLRKVPEMKEKVDSGKLTVATLSQVEAFVRAEKKSISQTLELLVQVEGKSKREVDRVLRSEHRPDVMRLELFVPKKLYAELKEAQMEEGLGSVEALLEKLVRLRLNARRKRLPSPEKVKTKSRADSASSRRIPAAIKRVILKNGGATCAFVSADGRRCNSTRVEFDHIEPYMLGGPTELENLRLLCRTHNRLEAEKAYGRAKVEREIAASRRPAGQDG